MMKESPFATKRFRVGRFTIAYVKYNGIKSIALLSHKYLNGFSIVNMIFIKNFMKGMIVSDNEALNSPRMIDHYLNDKIAGEMRRLGNR